MDSQRNLLVIALLFVSFMIWQAWEQDKNPQPQAQQTTQTTTTAAGSAADQGVPASGQGKLISVKTDVLDLTINTRGGDVEQALLPAYPKELNSSRKRSFSCLVVWESHPPLPAASARFSSIVIPGAVPLIGS